MSDEQKSSPEKGKNKILRAAAAAAATAAVAAAVTATGASAAAASTEAKDGRSAFTVQQLDEMLASADLENADNVRVVKALEIAPGSISAVQYDR
ncbi:hypothetical protein ACFYU9_15120 [Streptomyces sp. NPDC004327]|uniref:hypothetical protein n=1 Tax=unclassified Streptomyces TaxID=2593676 RepID=UPI0036858851